MQDGILHQRLGNVVELVVGNRTGEGCTVLTLVTTGQRQCASTRTTELVRLIKRQNIDLAAITIARIQYDVAKVGAVLLA